MNSLVQSDKQNKNVPTSSTSSLMVQRKCACGGVSKLGGQCSECESKKLVGGNRPLIQPKLKIGQPNDKYEQEADRVAEQVMRMPEPKEKNTSQGKTNTDRTTSGLIVGNSDISVQRQEEDILQAKATPGYNPQVTPNVAANIQDLRGGGLPLPPNQRHFYESRMGQDFSGVRIHTDSKAADAAQTIRAKAFTLGNNIVFNAGQYSPDNQEGKRLLAHELTHVVQQNGGASVGPQRAPAPFTVDTAEPGVIQRATICRAPPGNREVPGYKRRHKAIWGPANDAIEADYRKSHKGNAILTGGQMEQGGNSKNALGTSLPKGAPSRKFAEKFLGDYRGVSRQLTPDIIDFTEGTIYEIKPAKQKGIGQGIAQIEGYYKLAELLQNEFLTPITMLDGNVPRFNQDFANWKPTTWLITSKHSGDPLVVCTLASRASNLAWGNLIGRGLILYEVFESDIDEEEKEDPEIPDLPDPRLLFILFGAPFILSALFAAGPKITLAAAGLSLLASLDVDEAEASEVKEPDPIEAEEKTEAPRREPFPGFTEVQLQTLRQLGKNFDWSTLEKGRVHLDPQIEAEGISDYSEGKPFNGTLYFLAGEIGSVAYVEVKLTRENAIPGFEILASTDLVTTDGRLVDGSVTVGIRLLVSEAEIKMFQSINRTGKRGKL